MLNTFTDDDLRRCHDPMVIRRDEGGGGDSTRVLKKLEGILNLVIARTRVAVELELRTRKPEAATSFVRILMLSRHCAGR